MLDEFDIKNRVCDLVFRIRATRLQRDRLNRRIRGAGFLGLRQQPKKIFLKKIKPGDSVVLRNGDEYIIQSVDHELKGSHFKFLGAGWFYYTTGGFVYRGSYSSMDILVHRTPSPPGTLF